MKTRVNHLLKSGFLALLLPLLLSSCGGGGIPGVDACITNNTGGIRFQNLSVNNYYYDVQLNGTTIVHSLAPGATSATATEVAGSYYVQFYRAGTTTATCTGGYSTVTQCSTLTVSCNG